MRNTSSLVIFTSHTTPPETTTTNAKWPLRMFLNDAHNDIKQIVKNILLRCSKISADHLRALISQACLSQHWRSGQSSIKSCQDAQFPRYYYCGGSVFPASSSQRVVASLAPFLLLRRLCYLLKHSISYYENVNSKKDDLSVVLLMLLPPSTALVHKVEFISRKSCGEWWRQSWPSFTSYITQPELNGRQQHEYMNWWLQLAVVPFSFQLRKIFISIELELRR